MKEFGILLFDEMLGNTYTMAREAHHSKELHKYAERAVEANSPRAQQGGMPGAYSGAPSYAPQTQGYNQPSAAPSAVEVKISFDVGFVNDPHFKARVPFLLALVVVFFFTGYLFTKSDFHTSTLFDVPRLQYLPAKLSSVSFILFIIGLGACLALSIFYAKRQTLVPKMLLLGSMLFVAILLSLFNMPYALAYIALAIAVSAAAFFAPDEDARGSLKSFDQYFATAGKAAFIFALLGAFFIFNHVGANRDAFFVKSLAGAVVLSNGVPLAAGTPSAGLTTDVLASTPGFLRQDYKNYMASLASALGLSDTQKAAAAAAYDTDAAYQSFLSRNAASLSAFKQSQSSSVDPTALTTGTGLVVTTSMVDAMHKNIDQYPFGRVLYDLFPALVAILAFVLLYFVKVASQILAGIFGIALSKL